MTTNRWTAKRRASLALWSFVMLVLIVEGALWIWTLEFFPQHSSRFGADFAAIGFFCFVLIFASLWLSKGKPIFGS